MKKQVMCLALAICMFVSQFPIAVYAEETVSETMIETEDVIETEGYVETIETKNDESEIVETQLLESEIEDSAAEESIVVESEVIETEIPETELEEELSDSVEIIAQGECGPTVKWKLDSNNVLTFSGTGEIQSVENKPFNLYAKKIVIEEGITSIGASAFSYHNELHGELVLPSTLQYIGDRAFEYCMNISGELNIPDQVNYIGMKAFFGCYSMTGDLKIPENVTKIEVGAFTACYGLDGKLILHENIIEICNEAFLYCESLSGKLNIPYGVKKIGNSAFNGCKNFNSVSIPESVLELGSGVFANCSGLKGELVIPSQLDKIEGALFAGCSGFTGTLVIPEHIKIIETGTFEGCSGLENVVIPDSVSVIYENAFANCIGLQGMLKLPSNLTYIGHGAFKNCSGFTGNLKIPETVTYIGDYAFKNCSGFTGELVFPEGVTYIGESAFENCSGFTGDLIIPSNITYIARNTFESCRGFDGGLFILGEVEQIDSNAFDYCENIKYVYLYCDQPITPWNAFSWCTSIEYIVVPMDAEGYNSLPWTDFDIYGFDYDGLEMIGDFVYRLYNVCLDRNPDEAGHEYWTLRLFENEIDGISAAYGFIFSPEFINKNLCNEDFVEQLYLAFMGRHADAVGKADWVGRLENGTTREEIFNGFALSQEFKGLCEEYGIEQGSPIEIPVNGTVPQGKCAICGKTETVTIDGVTGFVKRLYKVCLNREADPSGLADWTEKLKTHKATGRSVAYGFIFSQEFINKKYSNADYVEHLYLAFMGRGSDPAGKADWIKRMEKNKWTRKQVFDGFVGSQEFMDICKSYGITRE